MTPESNHALYSEGENCPPLSFQWLLTYFLGKGRREFFPNSRYGYRLFSSNYRAEYRNSLAPFTSGQRSSPHYYTPTPDEANCQFCRGRWGKDLNLNFALRDKKYFLDKQQEALSTERIQQGKCSAHSLQTQATWTYQDIKYPGFHIS